MPAQDRPLLLQHHCHAGRTPSPSARQGRYLPLNAEPLDDVQPFESLSAAQGAIDGWVHGYNHQPHRALGQPAPAQAGTRPTGVNVARIF
jgi:hypothetical protein